MTVFSWWGFVATMGFFLLFKNIFHFYIKRIHFFKPSFSCEYNIQLISKISGFSILHNTNKIYQSAVSLIK